MATQKIFAQHNSRIDLSSLGNKNQVQVAISGPDLKLTSPQGSVTIVNGAMYSSLKDSQLSFQFQDGSLKGKDLLGQVNLENIDFKSADAFLVDHVQNKALQEEQEALKQKMRQAEKDKEEAEKAREKAEKEKAEAEKAALEAQEAQKSSQQIEEALNEFLTQANTKAALAQITPDERDISLHSASSLHKESSATVEVAQVNKNANRSSGLNNPAPNPKIDLKISLALDDKSNSSGQKDNLTNVTSPKLVGTTMPGTEVTIQKGSTTLGSTKADGQGNFTFTPTDLTDGPHEFMALGEYKGNKAQAKLSLVIKSSTQTPTFEMNSQDIALTQEERSDIFLIKNVTPTIHGKAEANTQVSVYNKKSTDDKGTRLDTVQVNSVGEWSYTFKDPQLAQGGNSIRVVAEDAAKNTADITKTIDLDSIPPTIEKIEIAQDSLISGRVANTKTPTFKITTEPDARIQLYLPGNTQPLDIRQSEKVADGKQAYYLTIPEDTFKNDGDHTIQVVATDKRGNSTERTEFNFEVDTVEVGAVEITLEDKTGDKASNFTDKESPKLLFKPTGKNITKIEIELKSSSDGSIQKGTLEKESLLRSWTPKEKLKTQGEYTVTATAYKGQTSGNPGSKTIHFYNTPPTIQTIELDRSDQGRDPKYTNKSQPTLLVKIDPKDASRAWKVEYDIKNNKGATVSSPPIETTNLRDSTYTVTPQTDWSHAEYTVIAKLSDKAGNSSTKSEVFYFNDTKPEPVITFAEDTDFYQINNKKIIDNDSKKFVIKNAEGGIALNEKDLIRVTLTKKMGEKITSESFDNIDPEGGVFSYNSKKEWEFVPKGRWEKADYELNVTVKNQYGSVGTSKDHLTFTIVDDVQQPRIELLSSDNTAYDDDVEGNITNKVPPKFKFTDIDDNAGKVTLLIQDFSVKNDRKSVTFEGKTLDKLREPGYEYTSELGEKGKSKNYSLTVTTHVGTKNKASETIDVLIDNQLTTPKITLDPEKHPKVLGNTVSSKRPTFRLTDIDTDVKEVKLTFSNSSSSDITFDPAEEISKDVANQGVSKKGKNDYTYTPQEDWSNGTYQITLTVTDQANNKQSSEYEVTIDTSAILIPKIILQDDHSFEQQKSITKNQTPSFKLENIDENAQEDIKISVFSGESKSSSLLGSKTITKKDATGTGFHLNKLINTENTEVNITQDGKYQIQAVVTSTTGGESAPGRLDFTIDSADAPAPTIELAGNTGTDKNPVTNKTQPKLILKNIDSSRLDSDNSELIKVTFLKTGEPDNNKKTQNFKYSQMQKKTKGSDDSTEIEYELTCNQESLEPGEYTVTANVTYQAGQVGSGQLNNGDVMTIYTTPPTSTIQFLEELEKVDGQFKVSKSQMKFQIVPNEKDVPPGRGTTSVAVILQNSEGKRETETASLNNVKWTADLSELNKVSKGGRYQVEAKVTDPHGNEGLSQPLSFELLDGLTPPVIKINAEDHTPYDQDEDTDIKITSKKNPRFTFEDIDDVVNKVTVSVSKSKEKNADPKTIKYTKIPEGKWKNDEDDQGYNSNQIPILFQEDGEYNMTLKAETTGGLEATSNRLTLGVYADVMAPSIAVEGNDEREEVLSGTATPTFEIKNVDPHAREINITATLGKSEDTAKKFQAVLNRDGSIKTNPDNGFFQKIKSVYKFKPNEGWNEGKYNIVVSVINEAHKESSDSSLLELIIDTSTPAQPSITLSDTSNTTHPTSLQEKEKWTSSRKPTFTIDLKDNNTDNPIEKVEVIVTRVAERVAENGIYIAKKDRNVWSPETKDKSSKKGTFSYMSNKLTFTPDDEWAKGEYSLSVKTYNSLNKPGDLSKKEVVNVNADKPAEPKIELAFADQTGKTIDKSNTKITNNPNPSFAISNINLKQDNIDERAVTITITKDGESKITGAKVTHDTGQFSYKTSNFKDTYGDGEYNATVRVINKAGIPSDSQEFTFEIDTTEPDKPEINWNSEAFKTAKNSDELKAVAKKGQIVFLVTTSEEIDDPRYITAKINNTGSLSAKEKVKDRKNVWKLTSNDSLSSGKHNLYVEVTDKAGNKTSAQGEFMVLDALPAPKIDMAHNTNAAGQTSTPYMINKVNMLQNEKRKLNISLDDNRLFPYVEMKAELISESSGSSSVLSIKKNNSDTNWTVEISEKQAEGKYRLKVTATDVLKMTKETAVGFEVDTTLTNIPVIELKDSGTKSSGSTDAQETTQTKPGFMIRNIPEDIYKINITISGDNNDYEIKNLEDFKGGSKEWGGIQKDLEDEREYSITVTFTDKAGNTSTNKEAPYKIKKIAPFVFKDPETDSGTQGDFKTNHKQPVLRFKNMSQAAVTALKITLTPEGSDSDKAYTYTLTQNESIDNKGNEYTIELIKTTSLKGQDLFPAGKYEVTLELTYENNEKYKIPKTLSQSLIINRDKPDAVHDVKYTFNEEGGVKTIKIQGEKPTKTDIFIQFEGQSEINITKKGNTSVFDVEAFETTQPWGQQKSFTLFVKDDIGNQSENTQVDIPSPPAITRYRALADDHLEVFVNKEDLKQDDKIILKNQINNEIYEHKVTGDNLTKESFQFTTNKAFTDKFTAYVTRARHESEQIQRTIPKPPEDVKYTFVGKGNYLVVKGDINTGERLNVKIKNGENEITEKSRQANERDKIDTATKTRNTLKTLRTNPLAHNFTEKNFEVFSSNEEGGESQSVKQAIKDIVLYWDSTTGHYRARFSNYTSEDIGEYNSDPFVYPYQLKLGQYSLVEYKLLKYEEADQQYRVIEFDDSFLYELCRFIDYRIFKSIRFNNPDYDLGLIEWKFNSKAPEKVLAGNNKKLEFVSLEEVLQFLTNDQTLDPEINTDKKNYLMNTLTQQFEIRPTEVRLKKLEGDPEGFNSEVSGKTKAGQMGLFFVLDGTSNRIYSETIRHNTTDGTFTLKVKNGSANPNFYLYFKTTGTGNSITSFWLLIESDKSDDWDHEKNNAEQFEKLQKLAKERLEGNNPAPPSANNSEKNIDASQEENARSTEDQSSDASSSETTNQPAQSTESSPEESTTEDPSERSKRSTSLTEQEENPVDTGAQQVNLTQPQKQDIPSELLEEPKTAAPKNPVELLNPITSEENTTADTTPSFTLNAPKDAPDAVKALVTLDNRPEYELELIDNQGVFTVEMPLAEGPHELKVKFIEPDGDWIRLDKTFTIDASSERILSSLETPDKYQIDLSTGSKTIPSKENADMLMMTPVLHLPEHEEESTYYS